MSLAIGFSQRKSKRPKFAKRQPQLSQNGIGNKSPSIAITAKLHARGRDLRLTTAIPTFHSSNQAIEKPSRCSIFDSQHNLTFQRMSNVISFNHIDRKVGRDAKNLCQGPAKAAFRLPNKKTHHFRSNKPGNIHFDGSTSIVIEFHAQRAIGDFGHWLN